MSLLTIIPQPLTGLAVDPAPSASEASNPQILLARCREQRTHLSTNGFSYAFSYTGEILANVAGGLRRGAAYEGLLKGQLDLDTEKIGFWPGGQLHVSGLYPHGQSPSRTLLGDIFTLSNIDAPSSVRLFELWFEQETFDRKLSLRVGQLAADEEFATTTYGCLFINGTCGWPALIALNAPSPAYPVGAPGARLAFSPNEHLRLQTAAYSGDPYPLDEQGRAVDPHGVGFNLRNGALLLSEATLRWTNGLGGLPGLAKLGGWYHTSLFHDTRRDAEGYFLADPRSCGVPGRLSGNWGAYATAEQQIYREPLSGPSNEGLGVFCRFGGTPEDRNLVSYYLEGGLNYRGLFPRREDDEIGVAVVHGHISDDARGAASDRNELQGASEILPDYEMIAEAEYRFVWRDGFSIQPGVHWVSHPGGSPALEDALIFSVRATIDF